MRNEKLKIVYITANGGLWGDNKALLNILEYSENIEPFVIYGSKGIFAEFLNQRKIKNTYVKNYFVVWPHLNSFKDALLFFPRLFRMLIFNAIAEHKISKIITKFQPNIIHTNIGTVNLGYKIAKHYNIPHVWHLREFQKLDFKLIPFPTLKSFRAKLAQKNNYNICVSNAVCKYFQSFENSQVIYDGVFSEKMKISYEPDKEFYFLFVGRISAGKGIQELISAFIQFCKKNNNFKLLIIGTGNLKLEKQLNILIKREQIENRVEFLGFQNDVSKYYKKAYATIVPSLSEAFGFVTVEAMINGCLVVGKNKGGTQEILQNGKYGYLYETPQELYQMLLKIANTPISYLTPLILEAQKYAYETYTIEQNIDKIVNVYKGIQKSFAYDKK